ncbi:sterol desaturase family protein [Variovorax sp. dw_954]|uniref:sterol desaturase family protein n=1 Tax=Variovorax sp. dw_954 TaxID=2720078 RepID=UPI001BD29FAB|nr:sterol desaturase family protein [Variovorax sp. dw_954]
MSEFFKALTSAWLTYAYDMRPVLIGGVFILLLDLTIFKRSLEDVIDRCTPSSLRMNVMVFAFNWIVMILPLTLIASFIHSSVFRYAVAPRLIESLPNWAIACLSVFMADLIAYFRHRFEHSPLLWRFHEMHHSDEQLNWFSLNRFHPVNRVTSAVIDMMMLALIGFPMWSIAVGYAVFHYYSYLVHSNLPWTFGIFGKLIVSPAMHRWHHAQDEEAFGKNFGGLFSIFDVVFGTYYCPGPCSSPTGVKGADNSSFLGSMLRPFMPTRASVTSSSVRD